MEQWLTPPLVISLTGLCLSGLSIYHARKRDSRQEFDGKFKRLEEALDELEKRVAEAEANAKVTALQVGLFWRTIEQQMAPRFIAPKPKDE